MAVYTQLSEGALRRHVRLFRLGQLIGARGVSAGTINTIYDVKTTRGRYILRILEDRGRGDALFEEALLAHLWERGLPVPQMVEAGRRGRVVALNPRQQLSVFHYMPGREIAVFEVTGAHAQQVGQILAQMHLAGRSLRRRRRSRYDPARIRRILELCAEQASAAAVRRDARTLLTEMRQHHWSKELPRGIIHSDLFIDNVRFHEGTLCGVLDFEMACTGPFVYDLAITLCDWAFLHDAFQPELARALVRGYEKERHLERDEKAVLFRSCRNACARFAATRVYDFEVRTRPEAQRLYKDYRHFLARLRALKRLGSREFKRLLRLT